MLICYGFAQSVWVLEYAGLGVLYAWLWGFFFFGLMTAFLLERDFSLSNSVEKTIVVTNVLLGLALILFVSTRVELAKDPVFFRAKVIGTGVLWTGLVFCARIIPLHKVLATFLKPFLAAGPISYAIYVIHFPIMHFVARFETAGWLPPYLGLLVIPVTAIVLAHVLEIGLQPTFGSWLGRLWKTAKTPSP